MIDEIRSKSLSFRDTILLSHAVLAIWDMSSLVVDELNEKVIDLALEMAEKYPAHEYRGKLLCYTDELLHEECLKKKSNQKSLELDIMPDSTKYKTERLMVAIESDALMLLKSGKINLVEFDTLVQLCLPLIFREMDKYDDYSNSKDDLMQIGLIGLIKAHKTFNLESGSDFFEYASRYIEDEIKGFVSQSWEQSPSEPLVEVQDSGAEIEQLYREFNGSFKLSQSDMKVLYQHKDILFSYLTERERMIVSLRYGLGEHSPMSHYKIAIKLGMPVKLVRGLDRVAVNKLKKQIRKVMLRKKV